MTLTSIDKQEKKVGKQLYDYQHDAIEQIFERLRKYPNQYNLLYQLPTGGGKTVIFSEIAKRYIKETGKKVLILTHRIELCAQTSNMLAEFAVTNKIINSKVKELPDQDDYQCFVAMVETLSNRLNDKDIEFDNVGLVIVDEAHYNSFRKLFRFFKDCIVLGVTATPLSSNINLPLKNIYKELIVGHSITELINKGFLAKATTYTHDVQLGSLKIGRSGDYTVSSSERLYNSFVMQDKLLAAYEEKSKGKKTLIFNNGINTSKHVLAMFKEAGYDIRHLDNTNTEQERREVLEWFKNKPDAILTSVSILTTGFDEPTVESIILNRATRSLTLYHQMIGRGSRVLPNKSEFTIIDLGNNMLRFGLWDSPVDWHQIFRSPEWYLDNITNDEEIERKFIYVMPDAIKEKFANSASIEFDMKAVYENVTEKGLKPKLAIERSIEQHAMMCVENSEDIQEAQNLAAFLEDDIEYRVKNYTYCICKCTPSYVKWLQEDYMRKLISKIYQKYRANARKVTA